MTFLLLKMLKDLSLEEVSLNITVEAKKHPSSMIVVTEKRVKKIQPVIKMMNKG
jgi:hypothetical protein